MTDFKKMTTEEMFAHDEQIFREKMVFWGVNTNQYFSVVLNNGLGDHLAFKTLMVEIIEKHVNDKISLAICYPELFAEYTAFPNVRLLSIGDALLTYGGNLGDFDIYKWMAEHKWEGNIIEAFRNLYQL